MLECVPCTLEHINQLKPRIREADRVELTLSAGQSPEYLLEVSFHGSAKCFAWLDDGVVLCVFGVVPSRTPGMGVPWMISSEEAVSKGKRLVRYCFEKIMELGKGYDYLYNYVHADNHVAVRWLKWCGFIFLDPIPWGPDKKALFYPFVKDCRNV